MEIYENIKDMDSKTNSLEGVKEVYQKAVIENLKKKLLELNEREEEKRQNGEFLNANDRLEIGRYFRHAEGDIAYDNSLGANDRWKIISRKNLFGLEALLYPINKPDNLKGSLFLKGTSGRYQVDKFDDDFFPNWICIDDILRRDEEERFKEIEEFYDMNNRDMFEKYGIRAPEYKFKTVVDYLLLDSILKDRYSEVKSIYCSEHGIEIKLRDGTEIIGDDTLHDERGITIRKDYRVVGKVDFDAISKRRIFKKYKRYQ